MTTSLIIVLLLLIIVVMKSSKTTGNTKIGKVGSTLFTGAAAVGRIQTTIGLVFGVIISTVLAISGVYVLTHPSTKTGKATATVLQGARCKATINPTNRTDITYSCSIPISFKTNDGKQIQTTLTADHAPKDLSELSTISIHYDPNNPKDVSYNSLPAAILAIIMLSMALLISGVSYVSYVGAKKSQEYAALVGGVTGINAISEIL